MKTIRNLQLQIHGLGLLIECANVTPKNYPEGSVRMKEGVLVSIAGQFMPNNPPFFSAFMQLEIVFSRNPVFHSSFVLYFI